MKSGRSRSCLTKSEAVSLLEREGCDEALIRHSQTVSMNAKNIAKRISAHGHPVDVDFVEVAALLHDIGRCRTHGVAHGVEGCAILKDYPGYARVCERHIGAGIDKDEAKALGLPEKDFLPETLEEKIIAHADNLVSGDRIVPIEEAVKDASQKLGPEHPAVKRIRELALYIDGLMKDA